MAENLEALRQGRRLEDERLAVVLALVAGEIRALAGSERTPLAGLQPCRLGGTSPQGCRGGGGSAKAGGSGPQPFGVGWGGWPDRLRGPMPGGLLVERQRRRGLL